MTDARDSAGNPLPDRERLPPFGVWLRKSSLDELPGLIMPDLDVERRAKLQKQPEEKR